MAKNNKERKLKEMFLFYYILGGAIGGALLGLLPFFIGRGVGKPNLGTLSLICCTVSGVISALLFWGLTPLVMIGFIIGILVCRYDTSPMSGGGSSRPAPPPPTYSAPAAPTPIVYGYNDHSALGLTCLSGPLKGRTYRVDRDGLMLGRDYDCGVRFAPNTPGISRHHCSIRWYQGGPALVDLSSSHGSFLSDGRQLPPNYPMPLQVGSCFYLGDPQYLFQLVQIG